MLAALSLAACAGMYGYVYKLGPSNLLRNDDFAVIVASTPPPQTDTKATDFYFGVSVQNIGSRVAVFDSGDLTVTDLATGTSYFSVSKNKADMELPRSKTDVITKVALKPGQTIHGRLWFVTPRRKADGKRIELRMGQQALTLER
jgi:hypothetical protein